MSKSGPVTNVEWFGASGLPFQNVGEFLILIWPVQGSIASVNMSCR